MNTSKALLTWYDCNRRELPWRHTRDPYAIWVSEIMLQQTQVATVIGYYQRWMITFPTITTLAEANLDQVLALWQGLGYYSRARSLHHAAGIIKDELGNVIPHTAAALRKLPGIGAYTSAAIASIAFGEPIAVVDGNVIRVLSRLYDLSDDVTRAATKNKIARLAQELLNNERPGDFNQAMMELGATICTPHSPLCDVCPWQSNAWLLSTALSKIGPSSLHVSNRRITIWLQPFVSWTTVCCWSDVFQKAFWVACGKYPTVNRWQANPTRAA